MCRTFDKLFLYLYGMRKSMSYVGNTPCLNSCLSLAIEVITMKREQIKYFGCRHKIILHLGKIVIVVTSLSQRFLIMFGRKIMSTILVVNFFFGPFSPFFYCTLTKFRMKEGSKFWVFVVAKRNELFFVQKDKMKPIGFPFILLSVTL